MVKNILQIRIKEDGSYNRTIYGTVRANNIFVETVQVVTPFPLSNVVQASYNVRTSTRETISQYLIPNGRLKGKDVIREDDPDYSVMADWNVFEVALSNKALAYISKYRGGIVDVSFSIGEQQTPPQATNYKGKFGNGVLLPTTATDGDYYVCDQYNLVDKDITWTFEDIAYYNNGWKKSKYYAKASTTTIQIPVEPNIISRIEPNSEATEDMDLAVLLAGKIGVIENDITVLENNKLDKRGDTMSGDLDMGNHDILKARYIKGTITHANETEQLIQFLPNSIVIQSGGYRFIVDYGGFDLKNRKISNLGNGTFSKDAVNLGQLNEKINIDFSGLNSLEGLTLNSEIIIRFGSKTYKTTLKEVQKIIGGGSGGGGVSSLVFTDTAQLVDWLNGNYEREDLFLPSDLQIGQILFTVTTAEPDYWVSELPVTSLYQLVPFVDTIDLSDYYKKSEVNTLLSQRLLKDDFKLSGLDIDTDLEMGGKNIGGLAKATENDQAVNLEQVNEAIATVSPKPTTTTITIELTDWNDDNEATVTITGIKLDSVIWTNPTEASREEYAIYDVRGLSQGVDSLTFKAIAKPDNDLEIEVAWL